MTRRWGSEAGCAWGHYVFSCFGGKLPWLCRLSAPGFSTWLDRFYAHFTLFEGFSAAQVTWKWESTTGGHQIGKGILISLFSMAVSQWGVIACKVFRSTWKFLLSIHSREKLAEIRNTGLDKARCRNKNLYKYWCDSCQCLSPYEYIPGHHVDETYTPAFTEIRNTGLDKARYWNNFFFFWKSCTSTDGQLPVLVWVHPRSSCRWSIYTSV